MHPNKSFAWNDREEMLQFVSERAFAHIFVAGGDDRAVVHAPILVIDQNERAAVACLLDQFIGGGQVLRQLDCLEVLHHLNSASRAT